MEGLDQIKIADYAAANCSFMSQSLAASILSEDNLSSTLPDDDASPDA